MSKYVLPVSRGATAAVAVLLALCFYAIMAL